jgi:MFS family permease
MVTTEPSVTAVLPAVRSRISWGAIIAGVVVAMILQVAMNMLGLSIGAAALDPGEPNALTPGFGTATVLWMAASILISLFVGGAVAGYMSGRVGRNEGLWHGLTVWAVTTILALWMLTSAAGSVLNGVTNALGQGLGLLGASAAEIVPEVADTAVLQDSLLTRRAGANFCLLHVANKHTGLFSRPYRCQFDRHFVRPTSRKTSVRRGLPS